MSLDKLANKLLALALACSLTLSLTACNSQNVLNDVQRFAPVVNNVLVAACAFTTSPLCTTGAAKINADEKVVFKLWQDYINAQAQGAPTPGLWNDLNAAFTTFVTDATDIFSLAGGISGPQQQEIVALVVAAQALLAVIESFFPAPPAGSAVKASFSKEKLPAPNPKTGKYDAAWFSSWQKNWNNLPLVKEKNLQIHEHNKVVRVVSFGKLQ